MRIVPLITATAVLTTLYLFVMERDALMAFAGVDPALAQQESAAVTGDENVDTPFAVVVERTREREMESAVILRGRTAVSRQVEVRAQTTGLVVSEPLQRGTLVSAGDLLCALDPGTRAASLAEAQARLAEAQINFNTASRLEEGGYAAQTRVASAEAAMRSAQAGVERAQSELDHLEIRAPFGGLLENDTAETGSLLAAGGLCATVMQLDPILLVGYAAEAQIDRLSEGAMAGARLSNGEQILGSVTFLAHAADPATRTFRVEVTVPNPDLHIRDGMSAEMLVGARATLGHLVPGSALTLSDDGVLGVRLVDDTSHVVFNPVSVLRDAPDGFWVAGLPTEADVIVVGQEYVTDGVAVRAVVRQE